MTNWRPPGDEATPDTIVGISFDDGFLAQECYTAALRLSSKGVIELRDAVTIMKDASGKAVVHETIDPQPARSAISGGAWAGFFGLLLGGPVGWLAGTAIGASAGAIRARVIDLGIPDEWVDWFREAVRPGTFTLVLLLGRFDREATLHELERFSGAHLVYANLGTDGIARIRAALHDESGQHEPDQHEPDQDEPDRTADHGPD